MQGASKGAAVDRILKKLADEGNAPDFVLCIGDDRSDEDMFIAMEHVTFSPHLTTEVRQQSWLVHHAFMACLSVPDVASVFWQRLTSAAAAAEVMCCLCQEMSILVTPHARGVCCKLLSRIYCIYWIMCGVLLVLSIPLDGHLAYMYM